MVVACPTSLLKEVFKREEAQRTAIYVLSGVSLSDPAKPAIYIGECESVAKRFASKHHALEQAEWAEIFIATTTEGTFNRAHALSAEHRLVQIAKANGLIEVINGGTSGGRLDEGDLAFAQEFAKNFSILAQTLGLSVFRIPQKKVEARAEDGTPQKPLVFKFRYTDQPIAATMVLDGKDFVIQAGSLARSSDMAGLSPGYKAMRDNARNAGILVKTEDQKFERFEKDFPTSSLSAAGCMIYGSSCSGPTAWYHSITNQSYKDWQAAQAATADTFAEENQ